MEGFNLRGRVALVALPDKLCEAAARALARAGCGLALAGPDPDWLAHLCASLKKEFASPCEFMGVNPGQEDEALAAAVRETMGGLDIVVCHEPCAMSALLAGTPVLPSLRLVHACALPARAPIVIIAPEGEACWHKTMLGLAGKRRLNLIICPPGLHADAGAAVLWLCSDHAKAVAGNIIYLRSLPKDD